MAPARLGLRGRRPRACQALQGRDWCVLQKGVRSARCPLCSVVGCCSARWCGSPLVSHKTCVAAVSCTTRSLQHVIPYGQVFGRSLLTAANSVFVPLAIPPCCTHIRCNCNVLSERGLLAKAHPQAPVISRSEAVLASNGLGLMTRGSMSP